MSGNSTKYSIQYCKQKTPILQSFGNDLGKEIRNNIEYRPFALEKIQNYNPIYKLFFEMNETNYNNVILNHKYKCVGIDLICQQNNIDVAIEQPIFIKYAPLLDPLRYLVGSYTETGDQLRCLPSITENLEIYSSKLLSPNNASYVDNFYCYLSSQLLNCHGVLHGVDYYGSALAIQSKYKFNAVDDMDYLMQSSHFRENNSILYEIESLEDPFSNFGSRRNKNRLILEEDTIELCDLEIEDIGEIEETPEIQIEETRDIPTELTEEIFDLPTQTLNNCLIESDTDSEIDKSDGSHDEDGSDEDGSDEDGSDEDGSDEDGSDEDGSDEDGSDEDGSDSSGEEEKIAYIFKFPVQVIMLEKCKGTLDNLFVKGEIQDENIANAILMQIIMTLLVYQKAYHFTHNDLHTNNIMWNETEEPFLYYKFNNKIYRVPTFGKIFKIIDFGRSIYKFQGKTFCSDSFAPEGDASSQYNCEPYFNDKKARLEPNYSFDLCRLGTSLYDFIFDEGREPDKSKMDSFQRVVYNWCTDDEGRNILYKKNGEERYPGFKLYKMIARLVHKHTPEAQLEKAPFSNYVYGKIGKNANINFVIDIDAIPDYTIIYTVE